jgi:hypothetical protein
MKDTSERHREIHPNLVIGSTCSNEHPIMAEAYTLDGEVANSVIDELTGGIVVNVGDGIRERG